MNFLAAISSSLQKKWTRSPRYSALPLAICRTVGGSNVVRLNSNDRHYLNGMRFGHLEILPENPGCRNYIAPFDGHLHFTRRFCLLREIITEGHASEY